MEISLPCMLVGITKWHASNLNECSKHAYFLNNCITSTFKVFGLLGACPWGTNVKKCCQHLVGQDMESCTWNVVV